MNESDLTCILLSQKIPKSCQNSKLSIAQKFSSVHLINLKKKNMYIFMNKIGKFFCDANYPEPF